MSKNPRPFFLISASIGLILQFFTFSHGQDIEFVIKIRAGDESSADIRGTLSESKSFSSLNIWFLNDYGEMNGLAKRFSGLDLYDKSGRQVDQRQPAEVGQIDISGSSSFGYRVSLKPSESRFAAAHISWVNDHGGILMLDDLLPQAIAKSAKIKLDLPAGWKATSTDYISSMQQSDPSEEDRNNFTIADLEKSVIFIGPADRRRVVWSGKARLVFNQRGEWQFNTDEGLSAAASIFANYEKAFGTTSTGSFLIGMSKFPDPVAVGNWEADTRGRTVTIISSDMPFKSQSIQRLHEQLRHELFHLWIPNGVNLTGNYDWFYEGFALYRSLKLGVAVNRIRFDDYLDTLSRAYSIDSMGQQRSLVDASRNRWSGGNTKIYARGMLVAFLCDVAMLEASKGKRSIDDVLREVYVSHSGSVAKTDANLAVTGILKKHSELVPIVERYVSGAEKVDWTSLITSTGLEAGDENGLTALKVVAKPSGPQKDLLDKLGYNSWRKLSRKE